MTRYTVVWHPADRDVLDEMWLRSAYRREIRGASDFVDRELAIAPHEKGESIGARFRRIVASPLEVYLEVIPQDRLVRVVHIRRLESSHDTLDSEDGNGSESD